MAKVTIPYVFTDVTNANADYINACLAAIAALVNGNLGDDNVPDDGFAEAKIDFDPTSGHDHSGGSQGKAITLAEADINFDAITGDGHDHDGADGGKLAKLAVNAGDQGTLKVKTGTEENITDGDTATVTFAEAFPNTILSVEAYWVDGGTMSNEGLGYKQSEPTGEPIGYRIVDVGLAAFKITNHLHQGLDGEGVTQTDFAWRAIGC